MKGKRVLLFFCCVFLTASEAAIGIFNITSAGGQLEASDPPSLSIDETWARTVGCADDGGRCRFATNSPICPSRSLHRKRFDVITSAQLSWGDALVYCKGRHTDLATIRSQEENDALVYLMTQEGLIKDNNSVAFWLGGTTTNPPKGYFWMTNGEAIYNYVNWHKGEPSGGNEKCLQYYYSPLSYGGSTNVKWNDSLCNSTAYIVCEYYS